MLDKVKSAIEKADHFEVDDGSGRSFKVAKAALSPALTDKVRRLYCGGKVRRYADGGVVEEPLLESSIDNPPPAPPPEVFQSRPEPVASFPPPAPPAPPTGLGVAPLPAPAPPAPISGPPLTAPPAAGVTSAGEWQISGGVPAAPAAPGVSAAPAAPSGLLSEARGAGEEAARRIAEAGTLAQQALKERQAAEAQARAAEYNAAAALVATQDEATRRSEAEAARLREVYQRGENALRLQRERLAAREKDLLDPEAMRIETRRVFSKVDPVGLIVGAMMAGAAEAGLGKGGGSELVLKTVNDAIDRDVLAQKLEKEGLRSSRLQAYQAAVGDIGNASQLLKADQQLAASAQARLEAQMTQSAQGRVMLNKLAADLSAQSRKTAEEAVNLITGQAIAQQKARIDAESHAINLRGAEASMAKAELEAQAKGRAEQRADEALSMSRAELALKMRQQDLAEQMALGKVGVAAVQRQVLRKGVMGEGLSPEEYVNLPSDEERKLYVTTPDPETGALVYRRAKTEKDAEIYKQVSTAIDEAMGYARGLDELIRKPTHSADLILPFTEAKARSEALQQNLKVTMKEIRRLGALTKADVDIIAPVIPDPQSLFQSDAAEAAQSKQLMTDLEMIRELISQSALTTRPGQKPVTAKGTR